MTGPRALVLGVDGGGTKTEAVVAELDGRVVGTGRAAGSNWEAVGLEGMALEIGRAVSAALDEAGASGDDVSAAVFGMAGVDWPDDVPTVRRRLAPLRLAAEPVVVNDAFVALRAGSSASFGVVSNVGTGTVTAAIGRSGATYRTMAVGWGEPVGAGGLVREALHAIAAHHQGVGPATVLTAAFLEASRFASVDAMFEALSRRQWRLDPALAPVVDLAAQAGDACAVEILTDSGRRHAEMAVAAAARVGLADDRFELVLAGSVHAAAPTAFAEAFAATVRAGSPGAVPTPLTRAPALGAVQLALDSLRA